MGLEPLAFKQADPASVAEWSCTHCGFRVHLEQTTAWAIPDRYARRGTSVQCSPGPSVGLMRE